jgi:hypothetical protein
VTKLIDICRYWCSRAFLAGRSIEQYHGRCDEAVSHAAHGTGARRVASPQLRCQPRHADQPSSEATPTGSGDRDSLAEPIES